MSKFYFTYGSEGHDFSGGWTEIEAEDLSHAVRAFTCYHPSSENDCLKCSSIYSEESFNKTTMAQKGNFGKRCHERIILKREEGGDE